MRYNDIHSFWVNTILLHFPEPCYAVGQWLNTVSEKPASAPPGGSFFKLMKHFLLYRLLSRKGPRGSGKRDMYIQ